MPEVDSVEALSPAAQQAFVDLVTRIASCQHQLGERFGEWCTGAPMLEASVAAASMAQEELGHSRVFLGLARGVLDTEAGERQDYDLETVPEVLRRPFADWLDFVAASLVADGAVTLLLESARDCDLAPMRQRVRKALDEEEFHGVYARVWAERLEAEGGSVARELRARVDDWLGAFVTWLKACDADVAALGPLGLRPVNAAVALPERLAR